MDVWIRVIGDYGFPAAVTFYLLYRMEKKLDQINQSVQLLYQKQMGVHVKTDPSLTALPPRSKRN
ncbi:YvrJ family protein [Bacillus sp. H-16]|uniref:YvrJ family protein n=1 Tax=Alteribacter keqinensis TaxID=2483800 RepID=A0A3M7TYG0_9BACI|nr:YvrJ family protein [Alteribacter salitolerans]RNA70648.1 YvrJ family protein [Alteribacter keqinensis]